MKLPGLTRIRGCTPGLLASLVVAVAATFLSEQIGMKSQLRQLASVGLKPFLLVIGETVFLAALVAGLLHVL